MQIKYLAPEVSDSTEVLHMKMWEGTVFDYSLNGNSGTSVNTTIENRSLGFNGTTSYIDIPTDAVFNTTTLTISVWVNVDSGIAGSAQIVAKATTADQDWWFFIENTDLKITIAGGGGNSLVSTNAIAADVWTHLVVVFQGTNGTIYTNGVLNGTAADLTAIDSTDNINPTVGCRWDAKHVSVIRMFPGFISDVRLYSTARTARQSRDFYNQTKWRYGV